MRSQNIESRTSVGLGSPPKSMHCWVHCTMIIFSTRLIFAHFFPFDRPLVIPSLSFQLILSFPYNFLSSQVTEAFHRTFRRVWPRFQPKFYSQRGDRSRQEGQECRKDLHPHPERYQGQGTCVPPSTKKRSSSPTAAFFPLNLDPHGGDPASPSDPERGSYLLHLSSLILILPHHHRHHSLSKRWARSRVVLEIANNVPGRGTTVACRWCALIGSRAFAPNPNLGYPY
jgi:hypothetical protein